MLAGKHILLIIGGGIAAFKSLDLIRRLRERGASVTPVLTRAGEEFVTPLSVSALAGTRLYRDLFDLTDEAEMGHIQLSRAADLIVVAPATADLMAKMAQGRAEDLASTLLLATDTPVLVAPAMNVRMWQHPATQRNIVTLQAGTYYVECFASVKLVANLGSIQGAGIALRAGATPIGHVHSMRTDNLSSSGKASMPFILTVASPTEYTLNFQRDSTSFEASGYGAQGGHAAATQYDHEIKIWKIA